MILFYTLSIIYVNIGIYMIYINMMKKVSINTNWRKWKIMCPLCLVNRAK